MSDYLTEEEEIVLSQVINGSGTKDVKDAAIEDLASKNLKLVYEVVRRRFYWLKPWDLADTIGDGNVGLMKAAGSYNSRIGRFSTWAYRLISQAITDGFKNRNPKILQFPNQADIVAVQNFIDSSPLATDEQIMEATGLNKLRVTRARSAMSITIQALEDVDGFTIDIEDSFAETPYDAVEKADRLTLIKNAASELGLGDQELDLVCSTRDDGLVSRMASEKGVVPSSIRMLKMRLLSMIRAKIRSFTGDAEFKLLCQ